VVVDRYNITLDLPNRPIKFRLTVVQEYFRDNENLLPKFSLGDRLKIGLLPTLDSGGLRTRSLSILETGQPKAGLLPALDRASTPALL
jgi:hypothetical protein